MLLKIRKESKVTSVRSESETATAGKAITYQFNDKGNVVNIRDELGYTSYASYSDKHENTVSELSKLKKVVINKLNLLATQGAVSVKTGSCAPIKLRSLILSVIQRQKLILK